jgi:uncharacterized cupin superfamily protein
MEIFSTDTGDVSAGHERVGNALGVEGFALNRYRLPPGTGLPSGVHTHLDQEEVFAVLDGTVTFETLSGEQTVSAGEVIRFAPGEYQTGANRGDEPAILLAVGAPRESEAVRVPLACPDCGHRGLSPEWDDRNEEVLLCCPDCDSEHRTAGCPDCNRDELRVTVDDGEPAVRCPDCGAQRAEPLYR